MTDKNHKRILVTSALRYATGPVHIGHIAGAYLSADIFVRYQRLKGAEVIHIGGTDEYGVPAVELETPESFRLVARAAAAAARRRGQH